MSLEECITSPEDIQAILNFQEYLRIPSVHPDVNYDECVEFLRRQSSELALPINIYTFFKGKPIVVLTWEGLEPELPSILLNSHMDVVPVYPEKWTKPPFGAEKDDNGNIYARGAQDMKSVGIQHLESVRRLKTQGVRLKRTIHICFVPDEEIDGDMGMKVFAQSVEFKNLNIGFALDESIPGPTEEMVLYNGEISNWVVEVHCPGTPGHGSLLLPDTPGEKVRVILNRFMDFREDQKKYALKNGIMDYRTMRDATTVNLTKVEGGVQQNVVPIEMVLTFDVRVSLTQDHEKLDKLFNSWCTEAGSGTYINYKLKDPRFHVSPLDDSNPWWTVFKSECDSMGIKLFTAICPGNTDARFIRQLGIPAFGFSPMNNTPVLLHDHDEFLNEKIFVKGIHIFTQLIKALGNS